MSLPLNPPLAPQLARSRASLPEGDGWAYEPKYDGFRAVVFVDGDETYLQSRNGKPLSRYFPELVFPPGRYVLRLSATSLLGKPEPVTREVEFRIQ